MAVKQSKRVNKINRPKIRKYITEQFNEIKEIKHNKLSLIDLWDVQNAVIIKFKISDNMSGRLVCSVLERFSDKCSCIAFNHPHDFPNHHELMGK